MVSTNDMLQFDLPPETEFFEQLPVDKHPIILEYLTLEDLYAFAKIVPSENSLTLNPSAPSAPSAAPGSTFFNAIRTLLKNVVDKLRTQQKQPLTDEEPIIVLEQQINNLNVAANTIGAKQLDENSSSEDLLSLDNVIEGEIVQRVEKRRASRAIQAKIDHDPDFTRLDLSLLCLPRAPRILSENIRILNLSHNLLRESPNFIDFPPTIEHLDLSHNLLTELSGTIGFLTNLKRLLIHRNQLRTAPEEIRLLKKLEILNMYWNPFDAIPSNLKQKLIATGNSEFTCPPYMQEELDISDSDPTEKFRAILPSFQLTGKRMAPENCEGRSKMRKTTENGEDPQGSELSTGKRKATESQGPHNMIKKLKIM